MKTGLERCNEALERLLTNKSHNVDRIDINPQDITPAMVSIEAGFDKGYLKRSRESHKHIISRIDSLKLKPNQSRSVTKEKLERVQKLANNRHAEIEQLRGVLDKVLTQNLMLVERVRELEQALVKYQSRIPF